MPNDTVTRGNRVLASLSRADFALLEPHLQPIDLPYSTQLERGGHAVQTVYFLESGFASVVSESESQRALEVGLIGREGMSGLVIVLGQDRALHEAYIQVAGA